MNSIVFDLSNLIDFDSQHPLIKNIFYDEITDEIWQKAITAFKRRWRGVWLTRVLNEHTGQRETKALKFPGSLCRANSEKQETYCQGDSVRNSK